MSRDQLEALAHMLSACLPHAMQINVALVHPDAFIRNSSEVLVGIGRDVLPASRAAKKRSLNTVAADAEGKGDGTFGESLRSGE